MAEINGGKFGEGLTVGAINEILIGQLSKLTKKDAKGEDTPLLSSEQMRWISALVGGVVSETTGGNAGQGGAIADSATTNNYILHLKNDKKHLTEQEKAEMQQKLSECTTEEEKEAIIKEYNKLNAEREAAIVHSKISSEGNNDEVKVFEGPNGQFYVASIVKDEDGNIKIRRDDGYDLTEEEFKKYGVTSDPQWVVDAKIKNDTQIKETVEEFKNEKAATYLGMAAGTANSVLTLLGEVSEITSGAIDLVKDNKARQDFCETISYIGDNPNVLLEITGDIGKDLLKRWETSENLDYFEKARIRTEIAIEVITICAAVKDGIKLTSTGIKNLSSKMDAVIAKNTFGSTSTRTKDLNIIVQKVIDEQRVLAKASNWKTLDGNIIYPPNRGAVLGTEQTVTLQTGQKLGRYGIVKDNSTFVTQTEITSGALSLPPTTNAAIYTEYVVVKPIPGVSQSTAMAWFDQPGGGLQYNLPMTIEQLKAEGYITAIQK